MIKFIDYVETPNEKHLGIASVEVDNILLRYKVSKNKEGNGFFISSPSDKIVRDGEEKYIPAFYIDSRSQEEEIRETVRKHVKEKIGPLLPSDSPF